MQKTKVVTAGLCLALVMSPALTLTQILAEEPQESSEETVSVDPSEGTSPVADPDEDRTDIELTRQPDSNSFPDAEVGIEEPVPAEPAASQTQSLKQDDSSDSIESDESKTDSNDAPVPVSSQPQKRGGCRRRIC